MEDATGDDAESVVGDEAHIVAQSAGGPRAGSIPDADVDRYANLILLCKVHHKLIDDQPATYSAERLRAMKREHELWAEEKFRGASVGPGAQAEKVSGAGTDDPAEPEIFDHVPDSTAEIDYVIGHRPWSWEYLLYAGLLKVGLRDAKAHNRRRRSSPLVLRDVQTAVKHVSALIDQLQELIADVEACFEPELLSKALGDPARPGDFRLIGSMARKLVDVYEGCADWSFSVRSAVVPRRARRLFEVLSHFTDRPMADIELYVERLARELTYAIGRVQEGATEPIVLTLICEITADGKVTDELSKEVRRVRRWS